MHINIWGLICTSNFFMLTPFCTNCIAHRTTLSCIKFGESIKKCGVQIIPLNIYTRGTSLCSTIFYLCICVSPKGLVIYVIFFGIWNIKYSNHFTKIMCSLFIYFYFLLNKNNNNSSMGGDCINFLNLHVWLYKSYLMQ